VNALLINRLKLEGQSDRLNTKKTSIQQYYLQPVDELNNNDYIRTSKSIAFLFAKPKTQKINLLHNKCFFMNYNKLNFGRIMI
jgi:hypothetical protein